MSRYPGKSKNSDGQSLVAKLSRQEGILAFCFWTVGTCSVVACKHIAFTDLRCRVSVLAFDFSASYLRVRGACTFTLSWKQRRNGRWFDAFTVRRPHTMSQTDETSHLKQVIDRLELCWGTVQMDLVKGT